MKLRTLLILICITALAACKKDSIQSYPHVLKLTGIHQKNNISLYINGGVEVKDKLVVDKFTKDWPQFNTNYQPGDDDVITFVSKDTLTFGTFNLKYYVVRKDGKLLFYSSYPVLTSMENMINPYIVYTSEIIPVDASSNYQALRKDVRVGYGNNNNIRMNFFVYKIVHADGRSYSMNQGGIYNELNKANLNNLKQGDTLAIQEYTLQFKK